MPLQNLLEFHEVVKHFPGAAEPTLRGVSLAVPAQGFTFITGRSGSGKSVLCRLAVGLLDPEAGQVILAGQPLAERTDAQRTLLRARFPYIVQAPALLESDSLRANVALAARFRQTSADVDALLEEFGIAPWAGLRPQAVGPGVRKRASLVRALALEPEHLFLDEPTTGLDDDAQALVTSALARIKARGLGATVISHDARLVAQLADRVFRVEGGKVLPA